MAVYTFPFIFVTFLYVFHYLTQILNKNQLLCLFLTMGGRKNPLTFWLGVINSGVARVMGVYVTKINGIIYKIYVYVLCLCSIFKSEHLVPDKALVLIVACNTCHFWN